MYKILTSLSLFLFTFFTSVNVCAQSNPAQEKYKKVTLLLEKNKIEAADKKLVKLLEEYPTYGEGWDMLSNIRNYQYEESKKLPNLLGNLTVTTKDSTGKELESDSLGLNLKNLFAQMSPEKQAYNNYTYTLRQAMLYSEDAYNASIYLRMALRDQKVDSGLGTKELNYYDKAEKEFGARNYNKAAKYYQRAIDINPNFYKALLYLGDSYYLLENYIEAIDKFSACVDRFPNLLEPRKYLVDAYYKEGLYKDALKEAISCMLVYPDLIVRQRMEYAAFELNLKPSFDWSPRKVFPNAVGEESLRLMDKDKQPHIQVDSLWKIYESALGDVKEFCSEEGVIVAKNEYSPYKYLEVYSWEKMLKNSKSEELEVAREMKRLGYLDCYVFLSRFHDDLYPQYQHFIQNNRERILKYYNEVVLKSI